jgi:hypothetical protein
MSFLLSTFRQPFLTHWSLAARQQTAEFFEQPPIIIEVADHVKWGRMIARGVRQSFHFVKGSQEEEDLEATAFLAIVDLARRFDSAKVPIDGDPIGAFRGWAAIEVRCRCRREARRLRNGGTYHTRREEAGKALVVERLLHLSELVDPRSLVELDEPEPEPEDEFDF